MRTGSLSTTDFGALQRRLRIRDRSSKRAYTTVSVTSGLTTSTRSVSKNGFVDTVVGVNVTQSPSCSSSPSLSTCEDSSGKVSPCASRALPFSALSLSEVSVSPWEPHRKYSNQPSPPATGWGAFVSRFWAPGSLGTLSWPLVWPIRESSYSPLPGVMLPPLNTPVAAAGLLLAAAPASLPGLPFFEPASDEPFVSETTRSGSRQS